MTLGIIVAIEMVRYELNIVVLIAFTVFYSSQKGHWTKQFQCLATWLDRRLTASQSQTKGRPILPQSPHGSIILISSFFQGLEAPYATKWCLKDRNRSVPNGNQRENKSLHLPVLPRSFTIGILSVIPRKKCRFTCFNGIPRGICWAAILKVIALVRQHREDISSQFGSIQPTQMTLEHPICSKERTSNWLRGKEWVWWGHTTADMKRRQVPMAVA
jgi:hypothetical protein